MERWQLAQMQHLQLEAKILKTQLRIREWYEHWDGMVYVSFSGGKDSTALLHLVRSMYPDVPAVFSDTGLEFPEIREFVKTIPNVTWVRPEMSFRQVIEKHGYPVVGKEQAEWIHRIRQGNPEVMEQKLYGVRRDGKKSRFRLSDQWQYLLGAPFKIGSGCCSEMKKKPLKKYAHDTERVPIIGTMAAESKLRTQQWLRTGCNAFESKRPVSTPISFWLEDDVWAYLRQNNMPYCKIYNMGYQRTGCIFCMFGAHLDDSPNRFQRLQQTHPKLWRYCMRDWDAGGLGMRQVLEFIGVPYENFILGEKHEHSKDPRRPTQPCGVQPPQGPETRRQGVR